MFSKLLATGGTKVTAYMCVVKPAFLIMKAVWPTIIPQLCTLL